MAHHLHALASTFSELDKHTVTAEFFTAWSGLFLRNRLLFHFLLLQIFRFVLFRFLCCLLLLLCCVFSLPMIPVMEFLFGFFPILPDILAELFLLSFSGNLIFDLLLLAFLDELLGHQFWVTELGSNLRILLALPASLLKVLRVVAHDILDFFLG